MADGYVALKAAHIYFQEYSDVTYVSGLTLGRAEVWAEEPGGDAGNIGDPGTSAGSLGDLGKAPTLPSQEQISFPSFPLQFCLQAAGMSLACTSKLCTWNRTETCQWVA